MAVVKFAIRENEPALYFASRYARSRGVKLYNFMRHSGLNLMNSAKYVESSFKLSQLTGNSPERLQQHSMVRATARSMLFGQSITPRQMERNRPRFCPACIAQDVNHGSGRPSGRTYLRAAWLVTAISACPYHDVAIITLPKDYSAYRCPDFSNALNDNWALVSRLMEEPEHLAASEFDRYFTKRLHGEECENSILDSLYYCDAVTFCSEIGGLDLTGLSKNRERKHSDGSTDTFCKEGFDLIKSGFDDLRSLLERAAVNSSPSSTGFGSVLHHIAVNKERPGYREIADLAREVAFSKTIVRRVLGETRSKNYTVRMAADTFSIGPQTAKKMFNPSVQEGGAFVPTNVAEELVSKWNDRIGRLALSKFLNVNTEVLDQIEQSGLLVRHTLGGLRRSFFLKAEVDAFLERIAEKATYDPTLANMQPLFGSNARAIRVLTGILDGTIRASAGPSTDRFNLSELLVHIDDLRMLRCIRPPETWTIGQVQMKLRLSANLLNNLSQKNVFETILVEDVKGKLRKFFCEKSVLSFKEKYVSAGYLARTKADAERVERRLAGIQPVFNFGGTDRVYRRSDLSS